MRNSTGLAATLAGTGLSTMISAAWALGIVPPAVWIVVSIIGLAIALLGFFVWRRGEPRHETPLDRIRAVLAQGIDLRTYVLMEEAGAYENAEGEIVGGEPYPITRDERLYVWAREAWKAVREHFPEYANEFYGEDYKLGSPYLLYAFSEEVNRDGRDGYLEQRIALLERIIARHSPAPKS